ncbi:MAG: ACT domain-containing protein [bacterium]|nr:ACT domain-containing protein [bacterium]
MRRVIKFGGTSLATPELVREAARHVARLVELGEQVAVVVSAPGNATSELLAAITTAGDGGIDYAESCAYASLGEEQSVLMMCAALRSFGVNALPLLPRDRESWPIIADCDDISPLSLGKVNEERPFRLRGQQTASRIARFVLPQLRVGSVPVIAGFFAVDSADRIVTLGRGGSDISAFIVASQISADEVDIVTDVKGVLSADPRLADNPRLLTELTLEDLHIISGAGARVLHPRALEFKLPHQRVRILDYRELSLLEQTGTSVLGSSETTLHVSESELSMLTLVGEVGDPTRLHKTLADWLAESGYELTALSISKRFTCIYLPSSVADSAYATLHDKLVAAFPELLNISLRGRVGELRLRSAKFLDQPGVLAEVTGVLANARINIIEMITGLTDISVFINFDDVEKANTLLRRVLEHYAA